jgi:exosome complex exonuclease DIS3/RRP44
VTFKKEVHFDADNYAVTIPAATAGTPQDVTIAVFDKIVVRVTVEKDKHTQRGKVSMSLAEPFDSRGL